MYFLGTDDNKIYYESPLPMSGNEDPAEGGTLPAGLGTYDIARQGDPNYRPTVGDLWTATDHADSPIRAYNPDGELTYASDVLDDCRGMAFGPLGGTDYLWVSNSLDGTIYQLSLPTTEVAGRVDQPVTEHSLRAWPNPFEAGVTFTGSGDFNGAVLEVYDLSGRTVYSAPFEGSLTWTGRSGEGEMVPAGVYVARLRGPSGESVSLRLTRL